MSPWDEGFKARQLGKDATENPYKPVTVAWFDWADGWKDLDDHLTARDEALAGTGWFGHRR